MFTCSCVCVKEEGRVCVWRKKEERVGVRKRVCVLYLCVCVCVCVCAKRSDARVC
jgi:hypothetical protein